MEARYPKAKWLGNGHSGGDYTGGPWKVVLHTTETSSLPGYNSGWSAPHLTFDPRSLKWYQHTDLTTAARSLKNDSGGAQTNRDQALQVEIMCYSQRGPGLWVGDLSAEALAEIREFLVWAHDNFGVVLKWRGKQAYSYAEANAPGFRMTQDEWDNWDGVAAHHDVPEGNVHWDTGALHWEALGLVNMATGLTDKATQVTQPEEEMTLTHGSKGKAVRHAQWALMTLGYPLPDWGADGIYGDETASAVKTFQTAYGLVATGDLDGLTLSLLLDRVNYRPRTDFRAQ